MHITLLLDHKYLLNILIYPTHHYQVFFQIFLLFFCLWYNILQEFIQCLLTNVAESVFLLRVVGYEAFPCLRGFFAFGDNHFRILVGDGVEVIVVEGESVGVVPLVFTIEGIDGLEPAFHLFCRCQLAFENVVTYLFHFAPWCYESRQVGPFTSARGRGRQM